MLRRKKIVVFNTELTKHKKFFQYWEKHYFMTADI